MSRPGFDPIPVRPTNDVYTGLLATALVASLVSLIILFVRYGALFPNTPLWG